jgi:hypothetical protein
MAPLVFIPFFNSTSLSHSNNSMYQFAGNGTNPIDLNHQFHLPQPTINAFGVVTVLLSFVGLVFTALQLRHMRLTQHPRTDEHETQHHRTNEHELAELGPCKSTHISSIYIMLILYQPTIRNKLSLFRQLWRKRTTIPLSTLVSPLFPQL